MRHTLLRVLLLALTVATAPSSRYRWAIKCGTDAEAALVQSTATMSVAQLCTLPRPDRIEREERAYPVERTVYTVRGKLLMYRREEDGDFHIVIQDERSEATLIAEIPDPTAMDPAGPWRDQIEFARSAFAQRFRPSTSRKDGERRLITVVGVGFWDARHGAIGAADNGIEIHPVIAYSCP